jgi:hypothetical protein
MCADDWQACEPKIAISAVVDCWSCHLGTGLTVGAVALGEAPDSVTLPLAPPVVATGVPFPLVALADEIATDRQVRLFQIRRERHVAQRSCERVSPSDETGTLDATASADCTEPVKPDVAAMIKVARVISADPTAVTDTETRAVRAHLRIAAPTDAQTCCPSRTPAWASVRLQLSNKHCV